MSRFFRKGQMIAVQGRMETRMYEDRNGVRRKAYTIVADSVHFADSKKGDTPSANAYDTGAPGFSNADSSVEVDTDESLPF